MKTTKKQTQNKRSVAYMQSLPGDLYAELEDLCYLYRQQNPLGVNKLNVQDAVRLILKSHMQALRGPTDVELARVSQEGPAKFIPGKCPRCLLRVDKHDYPVLVAESDSIVRCHVCGTVIPREEVPSGDGW